MRGAFHRALASGVDVFIPSVAIFELWYGVAKSARREENTGRLLKFLSGPVRVLSFDQDDAHTAGFVRAALEPLGRPIGLYDALIAGMALRRKLIVVTANVSEFARVKGLTSRNWAK